MLSKYVFFGGIIILFVGTIWIVATNQFPVQTPQEEIKKLRTERDMYNRLYREANTRLARFQDSINVHCICK